MSSRVNFLPSLLRLIHAFLGWLVMTEVTRVKPEPHLCEEQNKKLNTHHQQHKKLYLLQQQ